MSVLGIDPGLSGGLAWYNGTRLLFAEIPSMKARSRGRDVDWPAVARVIWGWRTVEGIREAWVERVASRPGQGVASMFKFGYIAGGLRGILAAEEIPTNFVMPAVWKKALSVPAEKEGAVARAGEIFPTWAHYFRGPKGGYRDGLAEAALIAYYGFHQGNRS